MSPNSPNDFFHQLIEQTKAAYSKSPIFNLHKGNHEQWNYSVCATPLLVQKPVLIGINWGVDSSFHEAQDSMPTGEDILHFWQWFHAFELRYKHISDSIFLML